MSLSVPDLIRHRWRQDRLPLLLYLIAFIVMTYPFVFRMHDSLPMTHEDTHTALWQNWSMREAVSQGRDVNYSELLFYPPGLDLSLQPRRWTSFPIWTFLYSVFGDPAAYNLTVALGILVKAYGMYLFGLYLFRNKAPAWIAGHSTRSPRPAWQLPCSSRIPALPSGSLGSC